MASIAEAIFLHSLSMWECHVKFSSIYIQSGLTEETCSIGTLSMESSSVSDRALNLCLEPINIICVKERVNNSLKVLEFTRICIGNHASVTGWQKLFFSYKSFKLSAAVAIATFEIYD